MGYVVWLLKNQKFQLTASQGGWQEKVVLSSYELYFNSQPHKEADGIDRCMEERTLHFNSQPHKEADCLWFWTSWNWQHFNSQPHKEADRRRWRVDIQEDISTHSLTRRLTTYTVDGHNIEITFQLTASQGGWPLSALSSSVSNIFQLTASQGGWRAERW